MSFSTFPCIYRKYLNTWECLKMLLLFNLLYVNCILIINVIVSEGIFKNQSKVFIKEGGIVCAEVGFPINAVTSSIMFVESYCLFKIMWIYAKILQLTEIQRSHKSLIFIMFGVASCRSSWKIFQQKKTIELTSIVKTSTAFYYNKFVNNNEHLAKILKTFFS